MHITDYTIYIYISDVPTITRFHRHTLDPIRDPLDNGLMGIHCEHRCVRLDALCWVMDTRFDVCSDFDTLLYMLLAIELMHCVRAG